MQSIYLIGSLRNPKIPDIGNALRKAGFEAFDDWFAAGERADDSWLEYEKRRGRTMLQAFDGYAAKNVFAFDHHHLDRCDAAVLVTPAGKSGHLELGYMLGRGKPGFVLFTEEPDRWDVMYQFATGVFIDQTKLIDDLKFQRDTIEELLSGGTPVRFQFTPLEPSGRFGMSCGPVRNTRDEAEDDAVFRGYAKHVSSRSDVPLLHLRRFEIREIVGERRP